MARRDGQQQGKWSPYEDSLMLRVVKACNWQRELNGDLRWPEGKELRALTGLQTRSDSAHLRKFMYYTKKQNNTNGLRNQEPLALAVRHVEAQIVTQEQARSTALVELDQENVAPGGGTAAFPQQPGIGTIPRGLVEPTRLERATRERMPQDVSSLIIGIRGFASPNPRFSTIAAHAGRARVRRSSTATATRSAAGGPRPALPPCSAAERATER